MAAVGDLLARAAYLGPVDTGVYLRPLDGTYSYWRMQGFGGSPYPARSYERRERIMATQLVEEPVAVARALTHDLTTALVGEGYDPYEG